MKARLRACAVCEAEGHLLLVRLRDPTTRVEAYYPPGGGIEANERPAETAQRETLEETGVRVRVQELVVLVDRYPFRWNDTDYDCTTHYFAAELEGPFDPVLPTVKDADYNLGPTWMPTGEALAALAVNPRIGSAVSRLLGRARRARWRARSSFDGYAAMLLGIHDHFRVSTERLRFVLEQEGGVPLGWIGRLFAPLAEMLHHHHQIEERELFPRIEKGAQELNADHATLTHAIDALTKALRDGAAPAEAALALARFEEVLVDHLDREEAIVVPFLMGLEPDAEASRLGGT